MWLDPNPITIAALSTWTYANWTMVAHHTCHGGYNRVDAGKYNSRGFALGSVTRRIADWVSRYHPDNTCSFLRICVYQFIWSHLAP